ncbi:MAG: hypothetical protein HY332_03965 [Chloroflexi bacterium]|nr:hypothetical protein [Chloroflexota bacterium]
MAAVAQLERHRPKGLFLWSRTQGLRQVEGPGLGAAAERPIPDTADRFSVLDHLAGAERGLYVLCDYGAYLAPFGQPEPLVVRRLRELAWAVKAKPVTVLFVGPSFPDLPELEKEVKAVDLPPAGRAGGRRDPRPAAGAPGGQPRGAPGDHSLRDRSRGAAAHLGGEARGHPPQWLAHLQPPRAGRPRGWLRQPAHATPERPRTRRLSALVSS